MADEATTPPAPKRQLPPDERRCTERGKDGERCKAYAVRGSDPLLCAGHAGRGIAANPLEAARQSAAVRKQQAEDREHVASEARKTVKQQLAGLSEELVGDLRAAYRDAIQTGSQEALRRAQAAEYLLSRVYGKPAQPTRDETPTVASALEELDSLSLEELAALAHDLPTQTRNA